MTTYTIGRRIEERYEVHDIKLGGMGIVYLAYDHKRKEPVAIKTFQDRFLDNWRARDYFAQEVRTWINLGSQPNIVKAYRLRKIEGKPHLLVELITGPEGLEATLRSWLTHGRVHLRQALAFGIQICLGMEQALAQAPKLVHRDLKPENVLVNREGVAKITDFGLARAGLEIQKEAGLEPAGDGARDPLRTNFLRGGKRAGTLQYMSPEQARGEELDVRSDIYAFGCILYEMVTGRPPLPGRPPGEWEFAASDRLDHAGATPALEELLVACLALDREQRLACFADIGSVLAGAYHQLFSERFELQQPASKVTVKDLNNLGVSLIVLGYFAEAVRYHDQALALDPQSWEAWNDKGICLMKLGQLTESLACLERAIEIDPSNVAAWCNKGILFEQLGRPDQALASYDEALQRNGNSVEALANKAILLKTQGQFQEAQALLDRALAVDPWNYHALSAKLSLPRGTLSGLEYADLWIRASRSAVGAQEKLQLLLSPIPKEVAPPDLDNFLRLLNKMTVEIAKLPAEEWRQSLEAILATHHAHDSGSAGFGLDREVLLQGLAQSPELLKGFFLGLREYEKGLLLRSAHRLEEATRAFETALAIADDTDQRSQGSAAELNSFRGIMHLFAGTAAYELGKPEETLAYVDRALALNPELAMARVFKAAILFGQERFKEALAYLETLPAEEQSSPQLLWLKSEALRRVGELDPAR
ncbi:MAG: tetratricopeptide repeat protein [Chloroflexi bacterium]|nr:tetratricopeptide repeat protein [Chloroflexota bacterium]MCI0575359.1 tetratricopeptide repeat protein [Chloroflexota bacterium]MCI0646393.1 tetratricopeptide repeat protein [Chloroflexota bacterium]MCI0728349.1 tetratricopeptide repeat protein [Chloroflexota bacterium]